MVDVAIRGDSGNRATLELACGIELRSLELRRESGKCLAHVTLCSTVTCSPKSLLHGKSSNSHYGKHCSIYTADARSTRISRYLRPCLTYMPRDTRDVCLQLAASIIHTNLIILTDVVSPSGLGLLLFLVIFSEIRGITVVAGMCSSLSCQWLPQPN